MATDVYVRFRTWNRRTQSALNVGGDETHDKSNHIGDVISMKDASLGTMYSARERTTGYILRINGVPDKPLKKFIQRYTTDHATLVDEEGLPIQVFQRPRRFCLLPSTTKATALAYVSATFAPAIVTNIQTYFNKTTEQPVDDILTISWDSFKDKVYDKVMARFATVQEIEA